MKRNIFVIFAALVICVAAARHNSIETSSAAAALPSPNVVISQAFGGGGAAANSSFRNDYVELFNRGSAPVNLNGWTLQYASASGSNWIITNLPNFELQPGQYFLIQFASNNAGGAALPTPDLIAPVTPQGFILNLSGSTGKLALVSSSAQLPAAPCPVDGSILDFLGYGDAATCFETAKTANLSATTAAVRNVGGCLDTDNNATDFAVTIPAPRNSSSAVNVCTGNGNQFSASGSAVPSTLAPGGSTLLRVTVFPAATPPSTNIQVVANLSEIGGSATQQFFDDGTNGDATAGDNIFSFAYTIPTTAIGGSRTLTATATDAEARTANTIIGLMINAPLPGEDPLILGNPSNATADVNQPFNYLLQKPQYSLSYHRDNGTPNWTAWRLASIWIGSTDRQDDFRPDDSLPAGWYRVTREDYNGSGFDRGHMTPSGDRTRSVPDNSATFLMTNMIPQTAENNQRAWERLESYCRELAQAGNELYIVSGGQGTRGTIAAGRVNVPNITWKVILVLPNGDNDLSRITKNTRTIAVIMPNDNTVTFDWRQYRTSVRKVESLTGYDFFSNVPKVAQYVIERRVDTQ